MSTTYTAEVAIPDVDMSFLHEYYKIRDIADSYERICLVLALHNYIESHSFYVKH